MATFTKQCSNRTLVFSFGTSFGTWLEFSVLILFFQLLFLLQFCAVNFSRLHINFSGHINILFWVLILLP